MKSQIFPVGVLIASVAITLLATLPTSSGQATASADDAAVSRLINEVATQQVQIFNNQAQIDEKLAKINEDVRQARLFVARSGGKGN